MPYHVGEKGSNGCSGYPVVDDNGKTVGCHPTQSEATDHMQALYANVPDASKADAASVQTSDVPENPSNSLNPDVGIKYPQYLKHDPNNPNCKCDKCLTPKFDDFWAGSAFARQKSFGYPSANNPLPAGHAEPNTSVPGVVNHPKSTIESKNPL